MNENLKDYFYFSKKEKNGILVLLIVLLVSIVFPYFYDFLSQSKAVDNQDFNEEIQRFAASIRETEEPEYKNRLDQYIIERYDSIDLFFFNPNTTSKENYKKLGFTDKQINTINNYLQKGGKFYVKDDFRKIYGIRQQQYQIIKPYILLPDDSKSDYSNLNKTDAKSEEAKNEINGFNFDPNTATDEDFKHLGLSDANIKTIRNYQSKIGKFKSKDDFKKIYGITEEKLDQLEPYISINQQNVKNTEIIRVEINLANIEELIKIKGIGKYSAESIIKYREKLGGYYQIEQILEIKSVSPEMFELFKSNIYVDKSKIKTISLNFAETGEFSAHPYLNYQQAKEIIKFRSANGPFQDKKQLLQNKILLELTYKKIEPYLILN
jgi:competence protein ComEA